MSRQLRLFDEDHRDQIDVVKSMWDNKYPCPCCDVGKLHFSKTGPQIDNDKDSFFYNQLVVRLFISCENCHTSFIRHYSKGEYDGKFD